MVYEMVIFSHRYLESNSINFKTCIPGCLLTLLKIIIQHRHHSSTFFLIELPQCLTMSLSMNPAFEKFRTSQTKVGLGRLDLPFSWSSVTAASMYSHQPLPSLDFGICEKLKEIQWNLVTKRSDITKPSYNKVILLVPALNISLFFYPDMRNLI